MSKMETAKKFASLLDSRDWGDLRDLIADNFTARGPTLALNKEQMVSYLQILITAFPDMEFGLTDFEEKDGLMVSKGRERGTHTGMLDLRPLGIDVSLPATGKKFELPETVFLLGVADGKVIYYGEEDVEGGGLTGLLAQLGVNLHHAA